MGNKPSLENFKLPRWNELPSISLYLDQMLSLIDKYLGDYLIIDGNKVITKTMVNNYVKQKYLKAPQNKKYDREAVASLFVIAILKPVYSIKEISRLIRLAIRSNTSEIEYNQFCNLIEEAVSHAFHGTTMPKTFNPDDPREILWNVCNSFACQLYVRNIFLQSHQNKKESK